MSQKQKKQQKMPRTNKKVKADATIKTSPKSVLMLPKKRITMNKVVEYVKQLENKIYFLQSKITILDRQRLIHHNCLNSLHIRVEQNTSECMDIQVDLQMEKSKDITFASNLFDDVDEMDYNWLKNI
jgi:hypothetical protein